MARTGRPPIFPDPDAFGDKVEEYLAEAEKQGDLPTHAGLALFLGISKDALLDYSKKVDFGGHIKKLDAEQERMLVRRLWTERNPVPSIFLLKALARYRENDTSQVSINVHADARLAPELEDALARALEADGGGETEARKAE